jgi:hypothetical protein
MDISSAAGLIITGLHGLAWARGTCPAKAFSDKVSGL